MDFIAGPAFWLILLTIGVAALGIAMAYAKSRTSHRTPQEKAYTERAARAEQKAEDRGET